MVVVELDDGNGRTKSEIIQVITSDGDFDFNGVNDFLATRLQTHKAEYRVVAIVGPQGSGKSTLLNHVFGSRFPEMDASSGRSQTTKGVWMARSLGHPEVQDITTIVIDVEGCDSRERGEDDTNYERQTALFALSVSDVLIINIWCHDLGRETGAGIPLIRTIMQVNLKLLSSEPNRRRTVLMFVIRDKSRTPEGKVGGDAGGGHRRDVGVVTQARGA
jgi:protein SEY1